MSVKISELTASSGLSSADIIPVVDNSDNQTQKATLQQVLNYVTGSTFNNLIVTSLTGTNGSITGDLVVGGKLTAQEYHTEVVSASIIYESGSTKFGNDSADTHQFSGSILLSGTLAANNLISGTTAQFTTISASSAEVSGNLVVNGTVNLADFPDYAYVLYTASLDKIVVYPGLYVSGNLTGSSLGAFQTVSASSYLGLPTSSGGTPGGINTTVQFNSGSTFSGSTNLIYNYTTNTLSGTTAEFTSVTGRGLTALETIQLSSSAAGNVFFLYDASGIARIESSRSEVQVFKGSSTTTASFANDLSNLFVRFPNVNGRVSISGLLTGTTAQFTTVSASVISASSYIGPIGGGGGGGDVTTTGSNTFTGVNTFNTNFITASVGITGSTAQFTTVTGSTAYFSNSVGIGTNAPTSKLYIEGGSADWNETTPGTSVGTIHLDPGFTTNNFGNAITFGASDNPSTPNEGTQAQAGIYIRSDGSYGTKMYLATTDNFVAGSKTRLMIDQTGSIGVGVTSPSYRLDVDGTGGFKDLLVIEASSGIGKDSFLKFSARTEGNSSQNVAQFVADAASDSATAKFRLQMIDADGGGWDDGFTFQASPAGDDHTYVGIGTISPTVRLDVIGNNTTAARFSSGSVIISGNLTVTGSVFVSGSSIYGQVAELTSSTSNYTLLRQDSGKFLNVNSGSAVTVTVPTGLPTGFTVSLCQLGAGQVTVSGAVGVSINNRQSHTKTAGQYAVVSIVGTSADTYVFVGDTTL